jgi:hypothetical protein
MVIDVLCRVEQKVFWAPSKEGSEGGCVWERNQRSICARDVDRPENEWCNPITEAHTNSATPLSVQAGE